jgi:hypothetical protein
LMSSLKSVQSRSGIRISGIWRLNKWQVHQAIQSL